MKIKDWFCFIGGVLTVALALIATNKKSSIQYHKNLEEILSRRIEYAHFPEKNTRENGKRDKYAFLICGDSNKMYKENLILSYKTLLENGFVKEKVYLLDYNLSSKRKIKKALDNLEKVIGPEDLFLIYTTGHGGLSGLSLLNEGISGEEFGKYLKNIHPKEGIIISDQCSSGKFVKEINRKGYVRLSASKGDGETFSNTFTRAFFNSLKGYSNSDINKDGKVSIEEAFINVKSKDYYAKKGKQSPQIYSDGIEADKVFLK